MNNLKQTGWSQVSISDLWSMFTCKVLSWEAMYDVLQRRSVQLCICCNYYSSTVFKEKLRRLSTSPRVPPAQWKLSRAWSSEFLSWSSYFAPSSSTSRKSPTSAPDWTLAPPYTPMSPTPWKAPLQTPLTLQTSKRVSCHPLRRSPTRGHRLWRLNLIWRAAKTRHTTVRMPVTSHPTLLRHHIQCEPSSVWFGIPVASSTSPWHYTTFILVHSRWKKLSQLVVKIVNTSRQACNKTSYSASVSAWFCISQN